MHTHPNTCCFNFPANAVRCVKFFIKLKCILKNVTIFWDIKTKNHDHCSHNVYSYIYLKILL